MSSKLENDTDLKFRYLENALPALNNVLLFGRQSSSTTPGMKEQQKGGGGIKQQKTLELRGVMERLGQSLYGIFFLNVFFSLKILFYRIR